MVALLCCPVCGGLLRNERHLHDTPEGQKIFGRVVSPRYIEVDENTVEIRDRNVYDYSDREEGGNGDDEEGSGEAGGAN